MIRNLGRRPAAGLMLAVLALVGCTSTPAGSPASPGATSTGGAPGTFPVTVSSCGVDYVYDQAPERVLLGAPGIVETLDALGVADSAIGYTLSRYPVAGLDRFPGLTLTTKDYTPSREFLIGAQPDLFLSNDEQQLLGEGTASKDDLAGIPGNLYVLGGYCADSPAGTTLDVVYADVTNLGAIYGIPDAAATLNQQLKERVAAAAALNPGEDLTAGAITIYDGKVYALSGSYYAAVLDALGLTNGFAALGANWTEITTEAVLASDLDVLVVTYAGDDPDSILAEARTLFANAPAVKNDRVVSLRETVFQSAGVALIGAVEDAAHQIFGG